MICVYCGKYKRPSGEHVISRVVLKTIFGEKVRNFTHSELFDNNTLKDYQHKILDVCSECNSKLSIYDNAGAELVSEINQHNDLTNVKILLNEHMVGWLIKTHLNFIRLFPDKRTSKIVAIKNNFFDRLINFRGPNDDLFSILVSGHKGKDYYWNENDERRISYFHYSHVSFPSQEILVSHFRIKALDTFMLLPLNGEYDDFQMRAKLTQSYMALEYGKSPDEVKIKKAIKRGYISIKQIISSS